MYELYDPTKKKKKEKEGIGLSSLLGLASLASSFGGAKDAATGVEKPSKITTLLHGEDGKSWEQEAAELAEKKRKEKMQNQSYNKTMGFGRFMI